MRENTGGNETHGRALFINDRPVQQEIPRSSARNERGLEPLIAETILVIGMICVVAFFAGRPAPAPDSKTTDTRPSAVASYDSHR